MITARATGDDGKEILVLGVTRANVNALVGGRFIRVDAETHPGFPDNLVVLIFFGENERACVKALQPLIGDATKVIAMRDPSGQFNDQPAIAEGEADMEIVATIRKLAGIED